MVVDFANLGVTATNKVLGFDELMARIQSKGNSVATATAIKTLTIKNLTANTFDTMDSTFENSKLERLEIENCRFYKVKSILRLFGGCTELSEIVVDGRYIASNKSQLECREHLNGLFPNVTKRNGIPADCFYSTRTDFFNSLSFDAKYSTTTDDERTLHIIKSQYDKMVNCQNNL